MPIPLNHDLAIEFDRDEQARQDFVSGMRGFVLNDMATAMKHAYRDCVKPGLARRHDKLDQDIVHKAMRENAVFSFYSAARYNAQELSWRSVIPAVARNIGSIADAASEIVGHAGGSISLDDQLDIPSNVAELDVHLMPGGYVSTDNFVSGAIYDNGLTVFTAGMIGPEIDDIGVSMAKYVKYAFPDFKPRAILDCGCTIGHHTIPWKRTFPEADVHGIDVSGSMVTYAHARAESLGVPVHFHQMNATDLDFASESFDLIFSSQFLHELPLKDIGRYFEEVHRVLRPGGMVVTMELPPNRLLDAYDQFYLDWDCYYNREPFYRAFRDADVREIVAGTGFDPESYFDFTVPQAFKTREQDFADDIGRAKSFDDRVGRLNDDFRYFGFGFHK